MFLEYWNQPEKTDAKFRGDWMLTGDEGHVDRVPRPAGQLPRGDDATLTDRAFGSSEELGIDGPRFDHWS